MMEILKQWFRVNRDGTERMCGSKTYSKQRRALSAAATEWEQLETTHLRCVIDTDWVERIEEGLEYIRKAIDEDRQFLQKEGSVVPIERARSISRDSVEHLSRHSEMITHKQETDMIIPDKVYVRENRNNYAVYENRFLYLTLTYLRDFVDLRYNRVIETDNTYTANARIERNVRLRGREMRFRAEFDDKMRNDSDDTQERSGIIGRIEEIRFAISAFLGTELIRRVSQAPMITPPIVQTNILKMDTNFREVYRLYEFIVSYDRDGYRVEEEKNSFPKLPETLSGIVSDLILSGSCAVYAEGNRLWEHLDEEARRADREEAEEALRRRREALEQQRKKIAAGGKTPEEYLLDLEEYTKLLEREKARLDEVENANRELTEKVGSLEENAAHLRGKISETLAECKRKTAGLEAELREGAERHAAELAAQNDEWNEKCNAQRDELTKQADENAAAYEAEIARLKEEAGVLSGERDNALRESALTSARLHAAETELGRSGAEQYADEADMNRLERERDAYMQYFEKNWKAVRKGIRKRYLWGALGKTDSKDKKEKKDKNKQKTDGE